MTTARQPGAPTDGSPGPRRNVTTTATPRTASRPGPLHPPQGTRGATPTEDPDPGAPAEGSVAGTPTGGPVSGTPNGSPVPGTPTGDALPGTAADDRARLAGAVAACVTAVLAALFGDWGNWSAPLGDALPGFPLPWGVTAGPPLLLVSLAGVFVAWAGAPSFARTWAHTAAGLAAATGLLALPMNPVGAEGLWTALSEAAHAGVCGVTLGWAPALAGLAVTRRRGDATGLSPYVWTTAVMVAVPFVLLSVGTAVASSAPEAACSAAECVTARSGLQFTGEVTLRLLLPAWAGAVAVLAVLRRGKRIRALGTPWQVLLALAAAGLTVLLSPGLVFGADV